MLDDLKVIREHFETEWHVIRGAPATFIVTALIVAAVTGGLVKYGDNEKIENSRQQASSADEQRDLYKTCLGTGRYTPECEAIAKDAPKSPLEQRFKAENDTLKAQIADLTKARDAVTAPSRSSDPVAFLAQAGGRIIGTDSTVAGMPAARAEGSGSEIDVTRAQVSAQPKAEFHLLLRGAHIFDAGKNQQGRTGVAILARLWNLGRPSAATNWTGRFLLGGKDPIDGQFTSIPKLIKLSGKQGKSTLKGSDSLDEKTSAVSVGAIPVDGELLFFVPADRQAILASDTIIEISVQDIYGNATTARQRVGDWLGPSTAKGPLAQPPPPQ